MGASDDPASPDWLSAGAEYYERIEHHLAWLRDGVPAWLLSEMPQLQLKELHLSEEDTQSKSLLPLLAEEHPRGRFLAIPRTAQIRAISKRLHLICKQQIVSAATHNLRQTARGSSPVRV